MESAANVQPPSGAEAREAGRTDARAAIREQALTLGFDAVGFARPEAAQAAGERLMAALAQGWHGEMAWLEARAELRRDPLALWPAARSAIVVGLNYGPEQDPLAILEERAHAALSVYARGPDYHELIGRRLKSLGAWVTEHFAVECKSFVDTAPVLEKPLAMAAGLGWQGKHTNLVSRDFGSWLFLGVLLTTLDLPADESGGDRCGRCSACLDICPTRAFPAPYSLDARRCISYLTIEHKGHIAAEFRAPMGNRIYGCDDCLAVCPWNKFAQNAREAGFQGAPDAPELALLAELDDAAFRARYRGTPIKRTGRDRFLRNVMIALGNSGDPALLPSVERRLVDASPLVRAMAVWALHRLTPAQFGAARERLLPSESDDAVRAEWLASDHGSSA